MFTSGFVLKASASSSTDAISIVPPGGSFYTGYSFYNMTIQTTTGGGRAAVLLSTYGTSNTNMASIHFNRTYLVSNSSATNNNGIYIANDPSNPNGGVFDLVVENSRIYGGISLLNAGDSLRFLNNLFTGPNAGLSGNQVSGAGQIVFSGNNVTSTGGGVVLECAIGARITHNEFEQSVASTEGHSAIIDINGANCTVDSTSITENQIQANAGIGTPLLIRTANAINTKIDSNRLATPTSYSGISNGSSTTLCGNNYFSTGTPHVSGTAPGATWGNGC